MPVTQWFTDDVPRDARVRLTVRGRNLESADIAALPLETVEATLDCTSGWYSTQTWRGVRLDQLLGEVAAPSIEEAFGHRIRPEVPSISTRHVVAGIRSWAAMPSAWPRLPGAIGGAGQKGILVGQVGGIDRAVGRSRLVSVAVPAELTETPHRTGTSRKTRPSKVTMIISPLASVPIPLIFSMMPRSACQSRSSVSAPST